MRSAAFLLTLLLSMMACETTDGPECPANASCIAPADQLAAQMEELKATILSAAKATSCDDQSTILTKGLGSKPCGGPWEYLIYPSNADTTKIADLVMEYNQLEDDWNKLTQTGSYCAIAQAPDSLACVNGIATAYHDGVVFADGLCCR